MKKLILSILLGAGLILSGPALAVTKHSLMHASWLIEPGQSKEIPIDFKQDSSNECFVIINTPHLISSPTMNRKYNVTF